MQYIENYRKGSGKNCRKRAKTPPKIAAKLAKKPQKIRGKYLKLTGSDSIIKCSTEKE